MIFLIIMTLLMTGSYAGVEEKKISVEELVVKIKNDKSRNYPAFRRVLDFIQKKEHMKAKAELKKVEQLSEFRDYYHYLYAEIELERLMQVMRLSKNSEALKSVEVVRSHIKELQLANPYTSLTKKAHFILAKAEMIEGDLHYRSKAHPKARAAYERSLQRFSEKNLLVLVPKQSVLNYVALCEKKPDEFCTSWELKLVNIYPKPERQKLFSRALKMSPPLADRTTSTPYKQDLDIQEFQKGFTAYLATNYDEAFKTWYELLEKYPRTSIKLRTKFWMAKAAQKTKQDARAETLYREVIREIPFSFYALLSSWNSGIDIARAIDTAVPTAVSEYQATNPVDVVRTKRAETFISSKAYELARLELNGMQARENMPNEYLVYLIMLNYIAQNHVTSFSIMSELTNRNYNGFFSSFGERVMFPEMYLKELEAPCKLYKMDRFLPLSVIKQESAFNSEAISTSNAFGLMQIIPPTARDLDEKIDIEQLFNPIKNTQLGVKYIRQLLSKYKGNVIWALAAYNAGPGNADRWKTDADQKGVTTPEEYIELIGFRETHDYVQNILRNYYWYTKRSKGDAFVNLPSLMQSVQ